MKKPKTLSKGLSQKPAVEKRIVLQFVCVAVALQLLLCSVAEAEEPQYAKPNIIFIMADDLGKLLLPLYETELLIKMPHLEQLAKSGVVFKNAYATPLCFSTRAELISGRYSLNSGAYGNLYPNRNDRSATTSGGRTSGFYKYFYKGDDSIHPFIDPRYTPSFALPLKEAGYATAVVGKWHLNDYARQQRILRLYGFDRWMMSENHASAGALTNEGFVAVPGYVPNAMVDFIVEFIKENRARPFFVYYPMNLVHSPYVVPNNPIGRYTHTVPERQLAMIEYVDAIIGRIKATLDELNLDERTIIFFSGDNGSPGAFHSLYESAQKNKEGALRPFCGKGASCEGGVSVPFVVSGGPVVRRGETEELTDFTDILPTLADFAGVSVVSKNRANDTDYKGIGGRYVLVAGRYKGDGYSIAPFLRGQTDATPRDWILYSREQQAVIRERRFKLWGNLGEQKDSNHKLYDLHTDPYEQINLYDSNEARVVAAKQRLERVLASLPSPGNHINTQFDPVDWNYGMLAHWSMNQAKFSTDALSVADSQSAYDAEGSTAIIFEQNGKLAEAIAAQRLHAAHTQGLFHNFVSGNNDKLFIELSGMSFFYRGMGKLIRMNQTAMELANAAYTRWIHKEYPSRRGDREPFRSSMTVSAWLQTQKPRQDIYLLKQAYRDKAGDLLRFSLTREGAVNFELTTNGEARKLQSKVLDNRLWGQWIHIAATWDGRDDCGQAVLYVNGEKVAEDCLGKPLSAEDTDDLFLGGFVRDADTYQSTVLVDDIALWRQPLLAIQVAALYRLGQLFSYNASQVDALFNTPEENGTTQIGECMWRRVPLSDEDHTDRLIIEELPDAVELRFGKVMAIKTRCVLAVKRRAS